MFGNREGPELFRRAVPWQWQVVGGVLFSAVAVGALLALSQPGQSAAPLVAIQTLIVGRDITGVSAFA